MSSLKNPFCNRSAAGDVFVSQSLLCFFFLRNLKICVERKRFGCQSLCSVMLTVMPGRAPACSGSIIKTLEWECTKSGGDLGSIFCTAVCSASEWLDTAGLAGTWLDGPGAPQCCLGRGVGGNYHKVFSKKTDGDEVPPHPIIYNGTPFSDILNPPTG